MKTNTIETRMMKSEIRMEAGDDGMITLTGLAAATGNTYELHSSFGGSFHEEIMPGAFRDTLASGADVSLLVEHRGLPLARTTNRTMRLWESSRGLELEAQMNTNDPDVASLIPKIRSGAVNEMSITFACNETVDVDWVQNRTSATRRVKNLSLDRLDVSIVRAGANPLTKVNLRSVMEALNGQQTMPTADGQHISPAEADALEIPEGSPVQPKAETTPPPAPDPKQEPPAEPKQETPKADADGDNVQTVVSEANPSDVEDFDEWLELHEKAGALY